MNESVVAFGPSQNMLGILTLAVGEASASRAVLMSNVGMHHRVGPFRLYVELARALATSGVAAFRFDHSGMGDSEVRPDESDPAEAAVRDLTDAMDFLSRQHGISEFVLVGLCSGVDAIHLSAVRDARVRGVVFIDGYSYTTMGYFVRRYVTRFLDGRRWLRHLQRRARRLSGEQVPVGSPEVVFERVYPPRAQFIQDIRAIAARGTRMLFIFTGTVDQHFNSERQIYEMLGRDVSREAVHVRKLNDTDHVFARISARASLIALLLEWVQ